MNGYRTCCVNPATPAARADRCGVAWRRAAVAALAALAVGAAQAQTLRIATVALTPYGMTDAENRDGGIGFEVGNMIAQEAGYKYENKVVPYARAVAMLESGSADFVLALPNERLRKISVQFGPVLQLEIVVVGRAGDKFTKLSDLHGRTVAVVSGAKYDAAFDSDDKIAKYSTNGYEQSVRMLAANHVDAVIGARESLDAAFKRLGVDRKGYGKSLVLSKMNAYLNYSKKNYDDKTAAALNAVVARLSRTNAIQEIVGKYFEPPK